MSANQNPVPGLILPAPNDQSIEQPQQNNNNAVIRWAKTVSPRMFTVSVDGLVATTKPPTPPYDGYLLQVGVQLVNFTSGYGFLTFPQPFPTGLISVQLMLNLIGTDFYLAYTGGGSTNLTGVNVWMYSPSLGPASGLPFEIDYHIIGW